jgi:hypothetical protein
MADPLSNSPALILPARPASTNAAGSIADIRDIRPPVDIPDGWAWLGWVLLALAVALLAWWAWRKWSRVRIPGSAPAIILPPHFRARQRLREALGLVDQPEPFCVLVSDTIRHYLEERFELHAPDRTTEEFLLELQGSSTLDGRQKGSLGEFLERCDLVKFARYAPSRLELEDLLGSANRLVDETAPPEVTAAPTPGRPAA